MCQALGNPEDGIADPCERSAHSFRARSAYHSSNALYSFALRLTRARADAEDLVSDTIVRAFDRWEQYTLGTNIRAWLFTILYHNFVNQRRFERREVALRDDEDGHTPFEVVGEVDPRRQLLRLVHR